MANLVAELNSLDFSIYIGGPLQAAIQAQNAASMAQVSFIQEVGFENIEAIPAAGVNPAVPAKKVLRYVDFSFEKSVTNPDYKKDVQQLIEEGRLPAETGLNDNAALLPFKTNDKFLQNEVTIKVPFLTMLTIPALRIEEMTIDFNAKLTSAETYNVSNEFATKAKLGINYNIVNFKASASYKRTSTRGGTVEKTYNMGVHVTAVNDEMPAGLDRILTMLEDSIASINA